MVKPSEHHEFGAATHEVKIGSERSFGLVFSAFFALLAGFSFWRDGHLWPVFFGASTVFLGLALLFEQILALPNRIWAKFGIFLGRIINPIVLGALFFLIITPFGLVRKLMGADPLQLKASDKVKSYWINRDPPGPAAGSMSDQF